VRLSTLFHGLTPLTLQVVPQHIKIAEAAASLEAARAVLYTNCDEIMATLEAGRLPTDEERAKYRCIGAFAGRLAFNAANAIWDAGGARGVYLSNPIARAYRDLCAAMRHFTHNWDVNAATHGRAKLGLPLDNPSL
jgi:3-hydroxy-9,10-secoandrosta-1,3,5(10)-triene-9,17-dione monooxygenase